MESAPAFTSRPTLCSFTIGSLTNPQAYKPALPMLRRRQFVLSFNQCVSFLSLSSEQLHITSARHPPVPVNNPFNLLYPDHTNTYVSLSHSPIFALKLILIPSGRPIRISSPSFFPILRTQVNDSVVVEYYLSQRRIPRYLVRVTIGMPPFPVHPFNDVLAADPPFSSSNSSHF